MNDSVLCDYTIFRRVRLNNLKLHCPHTTEYKESITLAYGPVSYAARSDDAYTTRQETQHTFEEVRFEVHVEDVAAQALNRVIEGQDVNALAVLDVGALVNVDEVSELDTQVVASDLVHLNLALLDVIRAQTDEDGISPLLAPE